MTSTGRDGWLSAVGVSAGLLVIAILVFVQAGISQSLGPLDLNSADRLALAIWIGAPITGGLAARTYPNRDLSHAALAVGLVVGLVIALFPASGTGAYTCWLNLPDVPMGHLLGRLVVGGLTGLGMALALLVTGVAARRLGTAAPGIVLGGAVNLGASVAAYQLFYGGVRCLQ
jgi:hypothetical protein